MAVAAGLLFLAEALVTVAPMVAVVELELVQMDVVAMAV